MPDPATVCLGDAVTAFLVGQSAKNTPAFQQELQRMVRWYGRDRDLCALSPWEIESFGQSSGADSSAKIAPVKAFLAYVYKEGVTTINLANHLKVKRTPIRQRQARRVAAQAVARLSPEGLQRIKDDLEGLKGQRIRVADDIKRAMADKDFRENAPLDAAREQQGHLESRIRDLEQTLSHAVSVDEGGFPEAGVGVSRLGSRVVVHDMEVGEELTYTLVDPSEVDLVKGKISVDSPVGKAFLNRSPGEMVEVNAPGGAVQYRIESIDR